MARYEHLPIYKASIDLAVYIEQIVAGFSRYHKYTLGILHGTFQTCPVEETNCEFIKFYKECMMAILDVAALQGMTQKELEALTKGEIITAIVGDQDKTECTKSVDGPNGQVTREYVTKDALGVPLKTEKWDWTYDKAGVVKEITKTVLDAKSLPIEAVKIATVDGVLKAVPVVIKEVLPVKEVVIK